LKKRLKLLIQIQKSIQITHNHRSFKRCSKM